MNKFNLEEYKNAKKQVKELPVIVNLLDNFKNQLYTHFEYEDVKVLYNDVLEALAMLETRLYIAKRIVEKKGNFDV